MALAYDGEFLYAGLDTVHAKVVQIKTSDMSTVATWEGDTGQNRCRALTCGGGCVYAGLYTTPGVLVKIDPSDMTTAAVRGDEESLGHYFDLFYLGEVIWVQLLSSTTVSSSTEIIR